MSYLEAVVYDPPPEEFPPIVVIFRPDGDILAARASPSREAAEAFLARVLEEAQAKIAERIGGTK
jgi:hypothetical protein